MAQVKTKRDKVEFNEAMINWTGYKRKVIDVQQVMDGIYIGGQRSLTDILPMISNTLCANYEKAISAIINRYGEITDVRMTWSNGHGSILAKALETQENFKRRVLLEERLKYNQGKMEEDRKERQKERDLKMYEKLKLKYNLP